MAPPSSPLPPELRLACDQLRDAHEAIEHLIEGTSEHQRAFEHATHYRALAEQLAKDAADLRARMAARIWAAEELSLTSLAARVGVSKARAAQFLRAAKTADDPKET